MPKPELTPSIVMAACCLLALAVTVSVISVSAYHSYLSPSWEDIEAADLAKFGPFLKADHDNNGDNSVVAVRALLVAEIHAVDADERATLDRLVTIVGGYSLLLGLTAFGAVKLASDQAKTQLLLVDKEVERLKSSMSGELLELRNLKDGLRALLFDLERTVPEESDWNAEETYGKLTPAQIQEILVSETTIAALPIFLSWKSSENTEVMSKLYRALAHFYLGRLRKFRRQEDGERAHAYTRKSLDVLDSPDGYRLTGSIFLAQYWLLRSRRAQ